MGLFGKKSTKVANGDAERSKSRRDSGIEKKLDVSKMTAFEREKYEEQLEADRKSIELRKEFDASEDILTTREEYSWYGEFRLLSPVFGFHRGFFCVPPSPLLTLSPRPD